MITSVTYARLYNLGNYENERIEVTVQVEDSDVIGAHATAFEAVETEHTRIVEARRMPKSTPIPQPANIFLASSKQRNYIATLSDQLGWHSEQLAVYATEQQIDLAAMTSAQASKLIDSMRRLANEELPL